MKYIKYLVVPSFVVALACMTSCKKFVQLPPSPYQVQASVVFSDSMDATAAIVGIYYEMMAAGYDATYFTNGGITVFTGLGGDELSYTGSSSSYMQFYLDALNSSTSESNSNLYEFAYTSNGLIYPANAVIEGVSSSNSLTSTLKNQLIGEAEVLRAFAYFNLVNLYGPVPLVTTTNYQVNATLPRTSVDSVYKQILADLLDAQTRLPVAYPSAGRVRVNQLTATALLARVYLYQGDWKDAYAQSNNLINSGIYTLEPNLNNVFLAGSKEAIWQLLPVIQLMETAEGGDFVPYTSTVIPTFLISNYLLSSFEVNDQRETSWIDSSTVNGNVYYYPYKYKLPYNINSTSTPTEDYMVFRLGEQYLIRAEAQAEGQGSEGGNGIAGAIADMNVIRTRAGLPNYAGATDQTSVLAAIMHERRIELFCEWGHRWYDLKRTNMINTVMGTDGVCAAKGTTWNADWALYPIPLTEIQANPFLTQNQGY
jgi:hypothetical protein